MLPHTTAEQVRCCCGTADLFASIYVMQCFNASILQFFTASLLHMLGKAFYSQNSRQGARAIYGGRARVITLRNALVSTSDGRQWRLAANLEGIIMGICACHGANSINSREGEINHTEV